MRRAIPLIIFFISLIIFSESSNISFSQDNKEASYSEVDNIVAAKSKNISESKGTQPSKEESFNSTNKEAIPLELDKQASSLKAGKIPVIIDGDEISYLREAGKVIAKGNVTMTYKEVKLFCDEAELDVNTNIAHIKGNVKVIRGLTTLYGENVIYDFNTYDAEMVNIRVEDNPFYGDAPQGQKQGQERYILHKGYITTCDLRKPHYRLVAKKVTIYPGDRVVARKVIFKIGEVPVFYIPYFSQSLKDRSWPIQITPGKNDEWGYFMLGRWRYKLNAQNKDWLHLDWYEKRGWAIGLTHKMESATFGKAFAKYYTLQDKMHALEKRNSLNSLYGDRSGVADKYLDDDRYRAELSYSWEPKEEDNNISVKAEFHKFSDQYFMKDFFEREYDVSPTPLSYILVTRPLTNSSLSLRGQKRVNHFYTQVEYLPQLEYDFFQQRLGQSKFYFYSSDKLSNLTYKRAQSASDDDALRFYSHNTLHYIDKIRWLNINSYIGEYSVFYSKNKFGDENILRLAPEVGSTLSLRLYKIFDKKWKLFGEQIDKMRHILTPEVTYTYIHDPTVSDDNLFQFDGNDSLSRTEQVVFTLKNKLQLRNKNRTWDFLYFSPSFTYRIHPEGGASRFETITADLEIYPKEGLSLTSDVNYDVLSRRITSFNFDFAVKGNYKTFEAGKEVERQKYVFKYGHRYTGSRNNVAGDVQGTLDFTYQLNPKLQFKSYLRYEYNRGDLEEMQYKLRTDLHCWWMDFGVDVQTPQVGGKNFTFWVMFRLKAFPELEVSFDAMHEGAKSEY